MYGRTRFFREVYWTLRDGRGLDITAIRAHLLRSIVEVGGVRIRAHPALSYNTVKSLVAATYEGPERTLIESMLHPDDVVMELGGGLGYISTVCARLTDSSRVFVYEANPLMAPIIEDTHRRNNVSPELNICMVGSAAGATTLHVAREFAETSVIAGNNDATPVTARVVALRDELARIKPTVLITDIEGGEYDLFRDFPPHACRLIMLELHPHLIGEQRAMETLGAIEAMGFHLAAQLQNSYVFNRV